MPYNEKEFKESNINYLNKDFATFKNQLIQYAQSYFPNTYRDFNETSPGMMLLEMSAYVGDVLSFYIDQQYKEMMLPLAEERRNIINMAKMLGYKVKPTVPAYVDITFTQEVNSLLGTSDDDSSKVDYSNAGIFEAGAVIKSSTDSNIIFQTLDVADFRISSSLDTSQVASTDTNGLASTYNLKRTVRAISAESKTKTFTVGAPTKFLKLTLPELNVVDIVSVYDENGNRWYEVDYLAQDKIPVETHYLKNTDHQPTNGGDTTAYTSFASGETTNIPVPYSLTYINTHKRFITETNEDNTTSIVFGNGILRNGTTIDGTFLDLQQAGITIPGQTTDLESSISPMLGNEYSTLGETPNQTTLTVTYRIGGGIGSNVSSGELTTLDTFTNQGSGNSPTVTNLTPAAGGKSADTVAEIREKAKAFFSTQDRCVTKEDYEARIMNMSKKFGNIAKIYVSRSDLDQSGLGIVNLNESIVNINQAIQNFQGALAGGTIAQAIMDVDNDVTGATNALVAVENAFTPIITAATELPTGDIDVATRFGTINAHILSYDKNKNLVGNPHANTGTLTGVTDFVPTILKNNIKNYLENYKILTDFVSIQDGYVINFGVVFEVVAHRFSNKAEVKVRCIDAIRNYFNIDKMQFGQPMNVGQLEYELMGVDGVRSVNFVCVTQQTAYDKSGTDIPGVGFTNPLYTYSVNDGNTDNIVTSDELSSGGGTPGYGWKYNFKGAYSDGIILPANPNNPAVFELKNPNQNIIGVVK